MTEDHLVVLYDLYRARTLGLVGVVKPEYIPEAHWLTEKGWVDRSFDADRELVWRLSDRGLKSLQLADTLN
jgi:hypothetical protein